MERGEYTHSRRPDFADARVNYHWPYLGQVGDRVAELLLGRLKNGRLWGRYEIFHASPALLLSFPRIFRLQPKVFVRPSLRYARKSEGGSGGHISHRLRFSCGCVKWFSLYRSAHARNFSRAMWWALFRGFLRVSFLQGLDG